MSASGGLAPGSRIVLAADHGGFELKKELVEGLRDLKYTVDDLGAHDVEPSDYPDYAHVAARSIQAGQYERAILVCGTGVGMAIVANRYGGVRAANCSDVFSARYSRAHNDCNVLTLGGRVLGFGLAWEIVNVWLATPFSAGERHVRRVAKMEPA
jgi:ribose 5-phosphate isomerase B